MINILLEGYDIDAPYLYDELKRILQPHHTVAVVAFSFRDDRLRDLSDWNALYGKGGFYYNGIVDSFGSYGIPEDHITFLNYFSDTKETARKKVENADILYFLGGLPDRMMERIGEFELQDVLAAHDGIVMGYSAGAVIQLAEYHLSPDEDYPAFAYYRGLAYLDGFYHEVHYNGTPDQNRAIQKVLAERKKPVYATASMKGAILVKDGEIKPLGNVKIFHPFESKI